MSLLIEVMHHCWIQEFVSFQNHKIKTNLKKKKSYWPQTFEWYCKLLNITFAKYLASLLNCCLSISEPLNYIQWNYDWVVVCDCVFNLVLGARGGIHRLQWGWTHRGRNLKWRYVSSNGLLKTLIHFQNVLWHFPVSIDLRETAAAVEKGSKPLNVALHIQ